MEAEEKLAGMTQRLTSLEQRVFELANEIYLQWDNYFNGKINRSKCGLEEKGNLLQLSQKQGKRNV